MNKRSSTAAYIEMEPKLLKKKNKARMIKSEQHTSTRSSFDQEQITPSQFSFAIMKISVSQICQSVGYRGSQLSALENLTHIAAKYLEAIATSAASYANASNRTQSNVFDIINGLQDLFSAQGFPGCSILHQEDYILLRSSALTELANFVNCTVETPFAKPIPSSNSAVNSIASNILEHNEESISRGSHIPKWLPHYPNARIYQKCGGNSPDRRRNGRELWENSVKMEGGTEICSRCENKQAKVIVEERKKEVRVQRERVRLKFNGG